MIETERTILRPITNSDNEQVFSYRSDSEINKYQGWVPKNLEEVNEFISKNPTTFNKPETWFQLVIEEKNTKEIIGDIGIHFIDDKNLQCEIGCTLTKKNHGKGFALETLKATISYLFNELNKHRIVTSIDPKNMNSIKLIERLGFRKEGHFKQSLWFKGEWVDDVVYAILKSEWK